jgi:two-component system OmpR family response regulator
MDVLVVEDEPRMAQLIRRGLVAEGFGAEIVSTGEDALRLAAAEPYDAILLDIMLPGIDGFETCRRLREAGVAAPVLMLTARESVEDRVAGLDSGADDYLMKPFAFKELVARLRALQRRGHRLADAVLEVDDLRLDPVAQRVHRGEVEIALSPIEYAVLHVLLQRPEQVLSRQDILRLAWGTTEAKSSNLVDVHVKHLRQKIDAPFGRRSLETVRGRGYRLRMQGPV